MHNHRKLLPLLLLLITAFTIPLFAASSDTVTFTVTRNGRKILLDGYLMEWRTETAHVWGRDSAWVWDVMATPEGLAGYIRLQQATACSTWRVNIITSIDNSMHLLSLPADSSHHDKLLRYDAAEYDSTGTITAEWIFPYKEGLPDMSNPMTLTLTGINGCSDTLPVVRLSYLAQPVKTGTKVTMIGQGVFIIILALLYFSIQRKIKLQTQRQMESPHQ